MSTTQSPPLVPQIETLAPSPSPPMSATSRSLSPEPLIKTQPSANPPIVSLAHSGSQLSMPRRPTVIRSAHSAPPPLRLVSTPHSRKIQAPPPTEIPVPTRTQSKQQSNYFSPRHTRVPSPSGNLSPASYISASSGSLYCDDRSQCSYSDSEHLSSASMHSHNDNPPYKPRRRDSTSLTMIKKSRRVKTDPHCQEHRVKRRHDRRYHCRHHEQRLQQHEKQSPRLGSITCQVPPTASEGFKKLCLGRMGNYMSSRAPAGTCNTFGEILSQDRSRPASPVLTRRWSSVEIGAHQIQMPSILPARATENAGSPSLISDDFIFSSAKLKGRQRSSTYTRGDKDHDIVRKVRHRLTLRELTQSELEIPASITLRRASGASNMPDATTFDHGPSGATTPRTLSPHDPYQMRPSATYLITRQDIDSITELIKANLNERHRHDRRRWTRTGRSRRPTSQGTRSPSITKTGLVPFDSPPSSSTVSVVKIVRSSVVTVKPPGDPEATKSGKISRAGSKKSQESTHEVIWQGAGGSPQSESPLTEEEGARSPHASSSDPMTSDKGDAFDPKNATASINEWSFRSMHKDLQIFTSSESEPDEPTPPGSRPFKPSKAATTILSRLSEEAFDKTQSQSGPQNESIPSRKPRPRFRTLEEPVSFPPLLARKTTFDWYSPLPEIDAPQQLEPSRSLYELGLDITHGPSAMNSRTPTPKASRKPSLSLGHKSRVPTIELHSNYVPQQKKTEWKPEWPPSGSVGIGKDKDSDRKGSIRIHPKAIARTGEYLTTGNSIGASSGKRRSSVKALQHVRTVDNAHKGEGIDSGRWRRPSKYPAPAPRTPSPSEEEAEECLLATPLPQQNPPDQMPTAASHRMSIVIGKAPPLPKVDHVGIYGQFTGDVKNGLKDHCLEDCNPHVCDDCEADPRQPSVDWIG